MLQNTAEDRTSWTWSSARVYLAQSPAPFTDERLIQFWHEDNVPGKYHGEWEDNPRFQVLPEILFGASEPLVPASFGK